MYLHLSLVLDTFCVYIFSVILFIFLCLTKKCLSCLFLSFVLFFIRWMSVCPSLETCWSFVVDFQFVFSSCVSTSLSFDVQQVNTENWWLVLRFILFFKSWYWYKCTVRIIRWFIILSYITVNSYVAGYLLVYPIRYWATVYEDFLHLFLWNKREDRLRITFKVQFCMSVNL